MNTRNLHDKTQKTVSRKDCFLRRISAISTDSSPFLPPTKTPESARSRPIFKAFLKDAIEVAWNRGRLDTTNQLLGVNLFNERDKPTNGEFISLIAEKAAGE